MDFLAALVVWVMVLCVIMFVIAIVEYVCKSLFLYKLAKTHMMHNKWMAWTPILQEFYLGEIAGEITWNENFKQNYTIGLAAAFITCFFSVILGLPEFIIYLACIVICVLELMAYYKIFNLHVPDLSVLLTVLVLFNGIRSIVHIVFICNKKWSEPTGTLYRKK